MTVLIILGLIVVIVLAGGLAKVAESRRAAGPTAVPSSGRRILFPFVAAGPSRRALDAALRLARAEESTLVPVCLARVPLHLPLDAPLPRQAGVCLSLQEAIEQRARAFGVPVDARIERGRTSRHALRQTLAHEPYTQIVIAAATAGGHGFGPDDVAWLLAHADGEIIVLRPGSDDQPPPSDGPRRGRRGGKADRNLRGRAPGRADGSPAASPLSSVHAPES